MTCAKEYSINHNNSNSNNADNKEENEGGMQRLLTFVYYLTPNDWDAKLDGGALRMYNPSSASLAHDIVKKDDEYFDITPHSGRLVVFRSDIIEHEVMPSNRRERIAITVWLYGQRRKEVVHDDHLWKEGKEEEDAIICRDEALPPILNAVLPPPLPMIPEDSTAQKQQQLMKESTIFVAIPSYRDIETFPTIQSLIETSAFPQRIYIGVVFQVDTTSSNNEVEQFTSGKEYTTHLFNKYQWNKQTHLRTITLDYRHATGPCYARHLAQSLHRGEDYILQIDSHMRFRPNWDTYLIHQLDLCPVPSMSVLTTYPPNYDPPYGPGVHAETRGTILVPWKFDKKDGLRQKGRLLNDHHSNSNSNIPCHLFAAGFNFFQSSLLDLCPYDGKLHGLFFGEEISMAVRLYTHGVDLYTPPMTVCYHKWKRNALRKPTAANSSTGGTDEEEDDDPTSLGREASLNVIRSQLRGTGRGLGAVRTVKQFEDAIGVDFDKCELSSGCENVGLDDDAFVSTSTGQIMIMADADNNNEASDNMANNDVSTVMSLVSQFMGNA
jgi:[Skp1-protein]-hydroxyproline N-acetylglucosaminyltransferase